MVSNYLVSLGSDSVVRGSLGAQLVSCFIGGVGGVGMMYYFVSMGRWTCGDGAECVGMMRACSDSDGSCDKIHTRGMHGGDFGICVFDGYVMMDVNGYGLLKGDMMRIREEWRLMCIYGCCSNAER